MSTKTGIQWTDATWNPVVGCSKVSQGCKYCYAKMLHDQRYKAFLAGKQVAAQYRVPFETVQLKPERLSFPLSWRAPRRIFVNSVSDLFHEDVPDEFILEVFQTMAQAEQHTFQVLTKRPARMLRWFEEYLPDACSGERPAPVWPLPNVWLGVSTENQVTANERIPLLLQTPAAMRFISAEPLIGPIDLRAVRNPNGSYLHCLANGYGFDDRVPRLDWVIAGGESGRDARDCDLAWIRSIVRCCAAHDVPCFVKQLGRHPVEYDHGVVVWPERELRDSHGADMSEWPEGSIRLREFPEPRHANA